jgi:hypothetical protein
MLLCAHKQRERRDGLTERRATQRFSLRCVPFKHFDVPKVEKATKSTTSIFSNATNFVIETLLDRHGWTESCRPSQETACLQRLS